MKSPGPHPKSHSWYWVTWEEIDQRRKAGETYAAIGAPHGVSANAVHWRYNYGKPDAVRLKIKRDARERCLEYRALGFSLRDIGKLMNCSHQHVANLLKAEPIKETDHES